MGPRALRARRFPWQVEYDLPGEEIPIGVVVPFDFNLDWEYWRYLPPEVELHFTRTPAVRGSVGIGLARALWRPAAAARAVRSLLPVNPAAVLYACSSGSFVAGVAGERELRSAMVATGVPHVVTSSSAMVTALRSTEVQRVALVTPYTERLTGRLVDFVEESGFEVGSAHYLGINSGIAQVSRATVASLVLEARETDADAVYVACTALRTYGIVAQLEEDIHMPVFTANQVSLWAVLVAAGALPRSAGQVASNWVMGDADPVARSTRLLMAAADAGVRDGAA